jgi:formiminotetrahydrofolate cyclodeaminase
MSDLVEAGILLEAAFQSARLNVEVNLALMNDRRMVSQFRRDLKRLTRT